MLPKLLIISFSVITLINASALRQKLPDVGLNVKQLIERYGYPLETHTVTTEDGYILELQRIPHGRNNTANEKKPVALLVPGVFCSAADWVNMGPENSLGFILADKGYDVWLGNNRGTTWSRKHTTLNADTNEREFFDFSFHEMGIYDIPAFMDYILNNTKEEKLFYIGHSQGTTSFFALASEKPEYNDKILLATLLSPAMYLDHMETPLAAIVDQFKAEILQMVEKYNIYELLKHNFLITYIGQLFCNDDSPVQHICVDVLSLIAGFSTVPVNGTIIPVITSNTPAGASFKQFYHYYQIFKSGTPEGAKLKYPRPIFVWPVYEAALLKQNYDGPYEIPRDAKWQIGLLLINEDTRMGVRVMWSSVISVPQIHPKGSFQKFDHGEANNLIEYGQPTPPLYDTSKITTPVAVFYGDKDFLCVLKDVEHALSVLPNVVKTQLIEGYNHLDFLWGTEIVQLLYNDVLEVMNRY